MVFLTVDKKLHSCSTSRQLINADGIKCTDDRKKSYKLNYCFALVFTNDNRSMPTLPKDTVKTSCDQIILFHLLHLVQ